MIRVISKNLIKLSIQNRHASVIFFCLLLIFFAFPVSAEESNNKGSSNKENSAILAAEDNTTNVKNKSTIPAYFPTTAKSTSPQRNIGFTDFLTSFLFLAAIVMLIFLLAWIFKRSGLSATSGNQLIKIVSAIPLGHKEKIALIEVGNQQVLVGISPGNIQKLLILEKPIKVDEKSIKTSPVQFSTQLFNSLKKEKNAN